MAVDKTRAWTDKELAQMEKRIRAIYQEAMDGISEKWYEYMGKLQTRLAPLQTDYEKALLSGDREKIKITGKKLGQAKRLATIENEKYTSMIATTAERIARVNEIATAYMNGETASIYAENYNAIETEIESIGAKANIRFDLVNEDVVKKLILDGEIELPPRKLSIPKDMRWNLRQLNSSVLQGILQGESMDKIANRIFPIVHRNEVSAIRSARTMVTGAENRGRLDSYARLSKDGLVIKKVWLATADNRTRDSHREINGQEREIGENFSNGLECPGDPHGAPEEVWNCRCTLKTHIIGFRRADGSISRVG